MLAGFAKGEWTRPDRVGRSSRCLVTAMRHAARSREIAELAVRFAGRGVVGFRHRRRGGRQSADAAPRRIRVHACQ